MDPPDWGGTKDMGVFLNFATAGATAQVAAGFNSVPPTDGAVKTYQVYDTRKIRAFRRLLRGPRSCPNSRVTSTP